MSNVPDLHLQTPPQPSYKGALLHASQLFSIPNPLHSLPNTCPTTPTASIMTIDSNPHSEPEPTWSLDESSHPHTFQSTWKSNPDPTALPFPRDNPPFNLTAIDWAQLALTDDQFTAHTWADLTHLISIGELDELKRWPSALKAYLAWSTHVKANYGSATNYLLQQRLRWTPESSSGRLTFPLVNPTPFGDSADYKILRNDWTYAVEPDVVHIVVWLKQMLPVDSEGGLTGEGREMVEGFVRERFRRMVGEKREGEKVLWFKNTTNLQSVRSLEHVHVLVRGAGEEVLRGWLN